MENAKREFLEAIEKKAKVKCASISTDDGETKTAFLKVGFTETDWEKFLSNLDFEYDDGYGGQELFGTIWLDDGTWISRGEYDGSEWLEHNVCPAIPDECV